MKEYFCFIVVLFVSPLCEGCCCGSSSKITMASANVTLENQLHSAQKNLLFLQQDHANTLKGLHAEIRRLQQQCTGERLHDLASQLH